jgi:transglutaminase-like putative cysteine protease
MKASHKFISLLFFVTVFGCNNNHLIRNKDYLNIVEKSFEERKKLTINRSSSLYDVFNSELTIEQTEGLKFLYAYMPLNDLADYSGDFFLANVDFALKAKTKNQWSEKIPEEIFLHYVLPPRVNNENLDSFRIVYYDEIIDRIKGNDIKEAALEINHWCHEKVSYQPSDNRTSAPMSTVLSARGRCGEESTFTVAALRTAGIPARQVYVPRWAHSDDNHAWVEVWINGIWYYMGACEPEPELDKGWFTIPASRAMLIHTKSFGATTGNENPIIENPNYTEVNNLSKYAPTKKIFVKVIDKDEHPVKNANVEYQLYNFAEFYPLAVVPTNERGISCLETGFGDLLIWVYKNEDFNFRKISVNEIDTLILKLNKKSDEEYTLSFELKVPASTSEISATSDELIQENSRRIVAENQMRQTYINSWMNQKDINALAHKIRSDSAKVTNILNRSMGNYAEISSFLTYTPDSLVQNAILLLESLQDKDLRDIKSKTLLDHLMFCSGNYNLRNIFPNDFFNKYIQNPRIANEMIVGWREFLRKNLPLSLTHTAQEDPSAIIKYINENVIIADNENYYKTPITPIGVFELKTSDCLSRNIYFVAICRSLGIPSRLEPVRDIPQYYFKSTWNNVFFEDQNIGTLKKGYLKLNSSDKKIVPEYHIHFTLARFDKGHYRTLEFDYNKKVSDFSEELVLPTGNYMLVTGNRLDDSNILSDISFFNINENEHKNLDIKLRKNINEFNDYEKISLENIISRFDIKNVSPERIKEKGVVMIWLEPEKETSKHIINDLPHFRQEFDSWGGYFLFLSPSTEDFNKLSQTEINRLPLNSIFSADNNMNLFKESFKSDNLSDLRLPVLLLADRSGNILFSSTGYTIGIGEKLLQHINY